MLSARLKIIDSSDEEMENDRENIETETNVAPENRVDNDLQFDSSEDDQPVANLTETPPAAIEEEPREPTKKDRQEAFLVGQRAMRELQIELPKRKPTINLNQFLLSKGIKR